MVIQHTGISRVYLNIITSKLGGLSTETRIQFRLISNYLVLNMYVYMELH